MWSRVAQLLVRVCLKDWWVQPVLQNLKRCFSTHPRTFADWYLSKGLAIQQCQNTSSSSQIIGISFLLFVIGRNQRQRKVTEKAPQRQNQHTFLLGGWYICISKGNGVYNWVVRLQGRFLYPYIAREQASFQRCLHSSFFVFLLLVMLGVFIFFFLISLSFFCLGALTSLL